MCTLLWYNNETYIYSCKTKLNCTSVYTPSSSPVYTPSSFTWTINPNGSEKIMRSTSLVLDESTASFELFYSDASNGWIVNGIS